jgi:deoxyguanosine kinase
LSASGLPFSYLAVDGPIGVGKTTLVEQLAKRFGGAKILEDVDNPFLTDFYKDRPGTAFQTQIFFLLSRYRQQQELLQPGLFERLMLADYPFPKDRIFAYVNLSDDELALYEKLYRLLEPQVRTPDLVLYLSADVPTCLERIRRRQRPFERALSEEYLGQLIDAYHHYYHYYDRSPLLVVETRHIDFVQRSADFEDLIQKLSRPIRGTEYYVPLGSR